MSLTSSVNEESKRVLTLLDEIQETQLNILEKMARPNEAFEVEMTKLNGLVADVEHYLPILKTLAIDWLHLKSNSNSVVNGTLPNASSLVLFRMQANLVLFSILISTATCLLCNQCGGERYGGGLRLLRAACCTPTPIECPAGLVCLRAVVTSPQKSFILSGCHVPEDGLIGCDIHSLPHNATIHRCTCLDQSCQAYFPNGDCPRAVPAPTTRTRKLLSTTSATQTTSTTTPRPFTTPSMPDALEYHFLEPETTIAAMVSNSGHCRTLTGALLIFFVLFLGVS
ncbi:unnamed protein product [Cylicocyclus nassatus]|uniref:Uncharacterized protein n=1 Tax=Cylicocyclus nassatus TaxID=53992 RepID=A0AA36M1K4_CYLNA|nr:unnamed protein product [Cylicocyclus nassatus]